MKILCGQIRTTRRPCPGVSVDLATKDQHNVNSGCGAWVPVKQLDRESTGGTQ
jgi:hypothetical protein